MTFLTIFYSGFQPLLDLFSPFFTDLFKFMQSIATLGFPAMITYYKVRESFADVQQDQMFSNKAKSILIGLVFIFVLPVIVTVIKNYFL